MPRLSTDKRDEVLHETRRLLLEAAAVEFAEKGFVGANINRISLGAGFAKGTIYNYFPSKRALMLALVGEIGARHIDFIRVQVEAEETAPRRLQRFFRAGFDFVTQFPAQAQVAISVVYGHDVEFKRRIYEAYERLFSLIIDDIVEMGVGQGDFGCEDTDLIAALLMSLYLGSTSQIDPEGKVWFDPDQVVAFVMDGLRKRNGDLEDEE